MLENYLVFWDIDWTMTTMKLPENIVDKIHKSDIEDISEGEFELVKSPDLDEIMEKIGKERQGVISNGLTDRQYKKLKGLGVLKYLNPSLIMVSHELAKEDMEKKRYGWVDLFAKEIHSYRRKEVPEHLRNTKVFAYLKRWEKPSQLMICTAADRYIKEYKKQIEPLNVFMIGDRQRDMEAIVNYGGRGLHVNSPNKDEITFLSEEEKKKKIKEIRYENFTSIPDIIGCWH